MTIQPRPVRPRLAAALFLAAFAPWPAIGSPLLAQPSAPRNQSLGETDPEAVVVYLVRHAERADDGTDDPPLALAGQIRVQMLRRLLADASLTHVHTTDWKRTRETARPLAEALGVEPSIYDAGDLEAFATILRASPATHLVVGHSNTTPLLVAALGGDPSEPIHDLEYDRLYIVVIPPGQPAVTTILRFGEPYVKGRDFGLRTGWGRRSQGEAFPR